VSYLIDALKKAERERHARRDGNLRQASAEDASLGGGRGQRWLAAIVVLLVAINGGLIFYLWHPAERENSLQGSDTTAQESRPGVAGAAGASNAASSSRTRAAGPAASDKPPLANDQSSHTSAADAAGNPESADSQLAAPSRPPGESDAGSTRFSATSQKNSNDRGDENAPENGNQPSDESRDSNLLDQSQTSDVPEIRINGQLFSSVPGRSFILVNGRRYHEGQRLAAGPAVESIGPTGAILRYHGQRYHVSGPGGG
jgi:general secretion pathway protein B